MATQSRQAGTPAFRNAPPAALPLRPPDSPRVDPTPPARTAAKTRSPDSRISDASDAPRYGPERSPESFPVPNADSRREAHSDNTPHLALVRLLPLMARTRGRPEVVIALIDGPVAPNHPDLAHARIRALEASGEGARCTAPDSAACQHGTFVAGILSARRGSIAPAICPNCTLLVRPIFAESEVLPGNAEGDGEKVPLPSATPSELAAAVVAVVEAGAHVVNLSVGLARLSSRPEPALEEAFGFAAARGVLVVAAAGNQGTVGSTAISRHPWVLPVVACTLEGIPTGESNLGTSIGRRGLRAPGQTVTSLAASGQPVVAGGSSVAAPFVSAAAALLLSLFPTVGAAQVKLALTGGGGPPARRATVVPPLLDAWGAAQALAALGQRL